MHLENNGVNMMKIYQEYINQLLKQKMKIAKEIRRQFDYKLEKVNQIIEQQRNQQKLQILTQLIAYQQQQQQLISQTPQQQQTDNQATNYNMKFDMNQVQKLLKTMSSNFNMMPKFEIPTIGRVQKEDNDNNKNDGNSMNSTFMISVPTIKSTNYVNKVDNDEIQCDEIQGDEIQSDDDNSSEIDESESGSDESAESEIYSDNESTSSMSSQSDNNEDKGNKSKKDLNTNSDKQKPKRVDPHDDRNDVRKIQRGNDKKYGCPHCTKRFKRRDNLQGHIRTHTGSVSSLALSTTISPLVSNLLN